MTNLCQSSVCVGQLNQEICIDNSHCNPGLFCNNNNICDYQIPAGKFGCENDEMCVNQALCNFTGDPSSSACVNAYSLFSGSYIASCPESGYNRLCMFDICISNNGFYFCGDQVWLMNTIPVQCSSFEDCISQTDRFVGGYYYSNCTCGYNPSGNSYCQLLPGDQPYLRYLKLIQIWLESPKLNNCNTQRRFISPCMAEYFADYLELSYQYYYVGLYPMLQGNSDCIKDVMTTSFWSLWHQIEDKNMTSASLSLFISFISLYIL